MSEVQITLSWSEVLLGALVGCMRNINALRNCRDPGNGLDQDNNWTMHIEGACGEIALAKHLDLFWSGTVGSVTEKDVGKYQVKTNTSRKWDDLIIKRSDGTDEIYVSILSFLPKFILTGWITGAEGKQQQWYREGTPGRPAFFVPRAVLHDMDELEIRF